MRAENQRMVAFLAANGIKARVKRFTDGSLRGTWRIFIPDATWDETAAAQLTALGFTDFDNRPLARWSGNGGMYQLFVRGNDELA